MLDTTFSRPKGDIGNHETFAFPVLYEVVKRATIERIVKLADRKLIIPFIEAAKRLEQRGAQAITTSCGFLALFQKEIQKELSVPFFSSSLMQIPLVHTIVGGKVGVLTARKKSLTKKHLVNVNVDPATIVIEGMERKTSFTSAIVNESEPLNTIQVGHDMQQAMKSLINKHPDIKAIVLECTNMPPYRQQMRQVTNLPIFDIVTLTNYIYASL